MAETIVSVQLTKIAEAATETSTPTPEPTQTPTPTLTFALPTPYPTQESDASDDTGPCLMARLVSETIPDNTSMEQGEFFEKTWVLQNAGTCTWTEQFSFVFSHGDKMGAPERVSLPGAVEPGESFTLKVSMITPAVAGGKTGFWFLQSADGLRFGTGSSGVFWVRINVENLFSSDSDSGPLSDSGAFFDIWAPISKGAVLETGETNSNTYVGDSQHDYSWQGLVTFDLINMPLDATVTSVSMVFEGRNLFGTPFIDLGCMGVYRYNYGNLDPSDFYTDVPGGALWSFCSSNEIYAGASRIGGSDAISAIQNSLGGKIQFRFQFNNVSDDDDVADYINLFPNLRIEYTTP
ncbi:MAG: hypothetical protein H8D34_16445 [Chloroflexi bacterium]|nr:hypothetical protein [Chloroflexota bacterium]